MSTFLELCEDLHRETGSSGPSSVLNQTGQSLRTVNWIKNSWIKIQNKHPNWKWMRRRFYHLTSSGVATMIPANNNIFDGDVGGVIRFRRWWLTDERGGSITTCVLNSADVASEYWLTPIPWQNFYDLYIKGKIVSTNTGTPAHIAMSPRNHLYIGPTPDDVYTIRGNYQLSAQVLADDGDEPEMPDTYHRLIVLDALKRYSAFMGAPELWADAKEEYGQMMRDLEVDQLPEPVFGCPIA